METIYQGIAGVVVTYNAWEEYIVGMYTDRFILELVGLGGGEVHFFIRTQTRYRNMIEALVYSQYPDAEIIEAEDYVTNFPKVIPNKDWNLWGSDMELAMPDPYPIKTYDKFEESITGEMIDPVASFVELFGSLAPGQNIWFQTIIEPLREVWREDEMKLVQELAGRTKKSRGAWQDLVDVITHLISGLLGPIEFTKEIKEETPLEFRLTPVEKDVLKAVEENLGKNAFKVKMRFVYLGRREGFSMANVSNFFGALKQFNDLNLNNIKPGNRSKTYAHFLSVPKRLYIRKRRLYDRYKRRNFDGIKFVLTTTELATVYHFPDMGVKTPSVNRVESKRGSAPSNLPIG